MAILGLQDLTRQRGELEKNLNELYHSLLRAARSINERGVLPDQRLGEDLSEAQQNFAALRDLTLNWAESLGVNCDPQKLDSLPGLQQLLEEAAKRESHNEEIRLRAIAVLDRALSLSHKNKTQFPLRANADSG